MSFASILGVVTGSPNKFAIFFTIGNIITILAYFQLKFDILFTLFDTFILIKIKEHASSSDLKTNSRR